MIGTAHSPWRRRFLSVVLCAIAAGPILLLLVILRTGYEYAALAPWIDKLRHWNVAGALHGVMLIDVTSLPMMLVYAVILGRMRQLNTDSLYLAGIVGALIAVLATLLAMLLKFGKLVSLDVSNIRDLMLSFVLGLVVGTLYWSLVSRVERKRAAVQKQTMATTGAME